MLFSAAGLISCSRLGFRVSCRTFRATSCYPMSFKEPTGHCKMRFTSVVPVRFLNLSAPGRAFESNGSEKYSFLEIPSQNDFAGSEFETEETSDIISAQDLITSGASDLQAVGLGSHATPTGLAQIALDHLHCSGLPWWATIITATVILRALTFPLILHIQRATPDLLKTTTKIRTNVEKVKEARRLGDQATVKSILKETEPLMAKYPIAMSKLFAPAMVQASIFVTFFFALRGMASVPLPSMKTGGLLWFTDLTVIDPYYILPVITCGTFLAILEVGADLPIRADQAPAVKNIIRILPIVMFPVAMNFPSAILCYWSTTNIISIAQAYVLTSTNLRRKLKLPPMSEMRTPI